MIQLIEIHFPWQHKVLHAVPQKGKMYVKIRSRKNEKTMKKNCPL